jgi:serine/threonine protein kinase
MDDYSERIEVKSINKRKCSGIFLVCLPFLFLLTLQDYEIIHALGKGGFATVYKARCHAKNQDVAIKMVSLKFHRKFLH